MYSSISSKVETVKKKELKPAFSLRNLRVKTRDLQICHAAASATRVNQGVEPWVLHQPLAS